jgi:hypothetical protein
VLLRMRAAASFSTSITVEIAIALRRARPWVEPDNTSNRSRSRRPTSDCTSPTGGQLAIDHLGPGDKLDGAGCRVAESGETNLPTALHFVFSHCRLGPER